MKLLMVGCSHHNSSIEFRERLAFSPDQARDALSRFRVQFPETEAVLLSTCNRTELYTASENDNSPTHHDVVEFLANFHGLSADEVFDDLFERTGEDAVRHLFMVAASLDSMVVGEAQILSQVKQAYELARAGDSAGMLTNLAFQAAIRVAKRVANETEINRRRVSIPSVAVADFASQIFEHFDDKHVLVIGAGEMGEETINYLRAEGATDVTVINRSRERADELAERVGGVAQDWGQLDQLWATADLVISTTGATEPIVTLERYRKIEPLREQQTLFILDLAVPRDIEPSVGDCLNVYLYSVDDLQVACEKNRKARKREWPKAERIIEHETSRFMTELNHRAAGPIIRRLKAQADDVKRDELKRLLNKLGDSDERVINEVTRFADRLVNKLLHPPLESLRDHAEQGESHGLLEALKKLFGLRE